MALLSRDANQNAIFTIQINRIFSKGDVADLWYGYLFASDQSIT